MLDTLYSQIGAGIVLAVCGFALWKGERTEQWGAAIAFLAWAASIFIQDDLGFSRPLFIMLAIDIVVMAAFGVLAWRSDRSWPIWATAAQVVGVAVHLGHLLDIRIGGWAYFSALALSSYGVLIALGVGAFIAWREREALRGLGALK